LEGTAKNQSQVDAAVQAAKSISGVKEVNSDIVIPNGQ
jgi:osmotically-inducible protein OsmY